MLTTDLGVLAPLVLEEYAKYSWSKSLSQFLNLFLSHLKSNLKDEHELNIERLELILTEECNFLLFRF